MPADRGIVLVPRRHKTQSFDLVRRAELVDVLEAAVYIRLIGFPETCLVAEAAEKMLLETPIYSMTMLPSCLNMTKRYAPAAQDYNSHRSRKKQARTRNWNLPSCPRLHAAPVQCRTSQR